MSLEGKGSFYSMGLTPWEEDILIIVENNGMEERENPELQLPLSWSNYNNGEERERERERESDETQLSKGGVPLSWSNYDNGEEREREREEIPLSKGGEADHQLSDEIVGSLVEAATLLGLEDNAKKSKCNIISKKEEHNAKERERRMKLSQTYFSLRSLLPNARRSKKRWSSTTIIDKVVDYIPTLQKEIEKLNQKKQDLMKAKEIANQIKVVADDDENPSVCVHQLSRLGEVIIQICINQRDHIMKLSTLIHKADLEAFRIIGASAVTISDDDHPTCTCHLHLQMDRSLQEASDYKSILRKKVISWLIC